MFTRSIVKGIALEDELKDKWFPPLRMSTLATVVKAKQLFANSPEQITSPGLKKKESMLQRKLT